MLITLNKEVECWLPVVGYEGLYEVSNLGRVKCLEHTAFKPNHRQKTAFLPEKLLKLHVNTGYYCTHLQKGKERKTFKVHRIVCSTYNPKKDMDKLVVNHINGNPLDNRNVNLEFVTYQDNTNHAYRVLNKKTKLSKDEVLNIKKELNTYKCTNVYLSKKYNVSVATIISIKKNKTWSHI